MTWLQLIALLVAAIAALIGIWTAEKLNKNVAVVTTVVTVIGVVIGGVLIVLQERDTDTKLEEELARHADLQTANKELQAQVSTIESDNHFLKRQVRSIQTTTPLTSLDLVWRIPANDIAGTLAQIDSLSNSISHEIRVSDDEIDRLGDSLHSKMLTSWDIDFGYSPRLLTVANPKLELRSFYTERTFVEAQKIDEGEFEDPLDVGGGDYTGPTVRLWFPFNTLHDAAVSLGSKADDRVYDLDPEESRTADGFYAAASNFGFNLSQGRDGDSFIFHWTYTNDSLKRAVIGELPTLAFPDAFQMILVIDDDSKSSLSSAKSLFDHTCPSDLAEYDSRLSIVYNGLAEYPIVYGVKVGPIEEKRERLSAYDPDWLMFNYYALSLCRKNKDV